MLEQRRWQVHSDSQTGCAGFMRWIYVVQICQVAQRVWRPTTPLVTWGGLGMSQRSPIGVGDDGSGG